MKRAMGLTVTLLILASLAFAAYVRLAPSDPARWHVPLAAGADTDPWDQVVPMEGAAALRLSPAKGAPADLLTRLDTIALATPRTTRLAGSPEEGRITWVTRSRLWGFPDYTTAEARPDGLYIHARLRFGKSDMGVNAARLTDWLSRL
ncbi:DUF1499 domain-containing protein [Rhodobacter sp. Har01]|uniref:DUF1499 domain-containing protein n=1 Tax=Rhodobacter sp. Har01 TaxID=2883999 RepID=UPI001D0884A0|nr:DUF1499 domain-containing protein [Rhodobacter sp. Har01]MCB6177296.1 DUF1499 domain-containing protein [Rhodobacter sp. Har01]